MLDPATDAKRLNRTIGRVFEVLRDGQWHNLDVIATATGDKSKRVSSRIRDLRLPEYGGYAIDKQVVNKTNQLWKYKLALGNKNVVPAAKAAVAVKTAAPVKSAAPTPANPVISAPPVAVSPSVLVLPSTHNPQPVNDFIKFFNTNTWLSELIKKVKCRVEPDGPHQRIVALDDNNNAIPHLVTTQSAL